jgi:hypothetical protein
LKDPFKSLAATIENQMRKHAQSAVFWAPSILGTITATGLKLDNFKHVIKNYLVADWTLDGELEGDWNVPAHDETGEIVLPSIPGILHAGSVEGTYPVTYKFAAWSFTGEITTHKFNFHLKPQLLPGDRVLVAPVNNGQDFVVISKVVSK